MTRLLLLLAVLLLPGCLATDDTPKCKVKLVLSGMAKDDMAVDIFPNMQSQSASKWGKHSKKAKVPATVEFDAPPDLDLTLRIGPWENGRQTAELFVDGKKYTPDAGPKAGCYLAVFDDGDWTMNFRTPKKAPAPKKTPK